VTLAVTFVACSACWGCSGGGAPGKFPPRPAGCEVSLFHGTPTSPTHNIGTVTATCGEDLTDEVCFRELKDQVCKLGGDVVWGVSDKPSISLGKKQLSGRAAHTKAPSADAGAGP